MSLYCKTSSAKQYVTLICYLLVFIFYSFCKIVKLSFFIGYGFFQRVMNFFICLEMSVNITQYQGSVGIFNNHNFAFRPKFTNFIGNTCWSTNHMHFKLYLPIFPMNLLLFLVFAIPVLSPRCSFSNLEKHLYINTGYYRCFNIWLAVVYV